jgi:signal transduction histidine kinase
MNLDTQTTIFMICFVYLMLHGAIWLALLEYRSFQVHLWCASGIISGVGVVLLSMRGNIPEFVFMYVAQFFMLVGNLGRMVALRMYLNPPSLLPVLIKYGVANTLYFFLFSYLIYAHQDDWAALILFNGFYAVLCFDYFRIGKKLNQRLSSLGAKLLIAAGLSFSLSLGVRTFGVFFSGDLHDVYAPSWDQAVMIVGQFLAITLSNIAFLRIFLEISERHKISITRELAITTERADVMRQTSAELRRLLDEREEIIRQLALFNKTAGMGALVASLAHELNQPLTSIQLNAELIDSALLVGDSRSDNLAQNALRDLVKDNERAANIIKTLRNMFGSGRKTISAFDLNELVNEVLLLCKAKLMAKKIKLVLALEPHAIQIRGDKSQMQQVLLNLITNAIDAFAADSPKPWHIDISTRMLDSHAELVVTDNGSGIAPEIMASVFELLRTNKDDGMGVGLWLSRTIVEAHQGSINFESTSAGTSFRVTLPVTSDEMIY